MVLDGADRVASCGTKRPMRNGGRLERTARGSDRAAVARALGWVFAAPRRAALRSPIRVIALNGVDHVGVPVDLEVRDFGCSKHGRAEMITTR